MILNTNFLTEEEYYNNMKMQVLDEGIFSSLIKGAATLLGYSGLAVFAGFGAALLAKSAVSKEGKINRFFRRIFGKKKDLDFDAVKGRAVVKREIDKTKEFKNALQDVFNAIDHSDWDEAERLFKDSKFSENPDAIKVIALAITDKIGEPPLFVYPSGNETYFVCKKVLGMKYAKALAQSVLAALKQNKSYHEDVKRLDLDV